MANALAPNRNALAQGNALAEVRAWEPGIMDNVRNYAMNALAPLFGGDVRAANAYYRDKIQPTAEYLPGVGDAMAAAEAKDAFSQGDYGKAAVDAGAAAVGLVPGVGDILAGAGKAIFAGIGAATANKALLKKAEDMASAGASRDDIWRDTGWFQGVDGKWRFEIDDSQMELADNAVRGFPQYGKFGKVENVLRNANVLNEYDLPYEMDLRPSNDRRGSAKAPTYWGTNVPSRGVVAGDVQDYGRLTVSAPDRDAALDTAVHELQHAVQAKEGFARGSNLSLEAAEIAAARDAEIYNAAFAKLSPEDQKAILRHNELKAEWNGGGTIPADVVFEIKDILARPSIKQFQNDLTDLRMLRKQAGGGRGALESGAIDREAAFDRYRRVAGEVEARNAERRRFLLPHERKLHAPWETQDVPDAEQIVRFK